MKESAITALAKDKWRW